MPFDFRRLPTEPESANAMQLRVRAALDGWRPLPLGTRSAARPLAVLRDVVAPRRRPLPDKAGGPC